MKNILVLCGPTASGKTSLALKIAKEIVLTSTKVNILSADSRQVYKDLDIVTGKDIPKNISPNIQVFGLNLVNANQDFNVSDFVEYSQKVIADSLATNTPLIIVGGTGLYLQAITSNLLSVHVPPDPQLRDELEKLDLSALKKRLMEINSAKFASLNNSDANNPRRLIRAIEISSSTTIQNQSVIPGLTRNPSNNTEKPTFLWFGITQDKETQLESIKQRVLGRLKNGAIREVQKLREKYPDTKLPIYSSLGIKQIVAYQNQEISLEELIALWVTAESQYARRQTVWFKKQTNIIWYDKSKIDTTLAVSLAKKLK